jgi:CheY-like chemotaxis protein
MLLKKIQSKPIQLLEGQNGQEAVCANNPNISVVFMDIRMPVLNGFEAYER